MIYRINTRNVEKLFVKESVRKLLNNAHTKNISVSIFGESEESCSENQDVVKFKIKHWFVNSYSVVGGLVYPACVVP